MQGWKLDREGGDLLTRLHIPSVLDLHVVCIGCIQDANTPPSCGGGWGITVDGVLLMFVYSEIAICVSGEGRMFGNVMRILDKALLPPPISQRAYSCWIVHSTWVMMIVIIIRCFHHLIMAWTWVWSQVSNSLVFCFFAVHVQPIMIVGRKEFKSNRWQEYQYEGEELKAFRISRAGMGIFMDEMDWYVAVRNHLFVSISMTMEFFAILCAWKGGQGLVYIVEDKNEYMPVIWGIKKR